LTELGEIHVAQAILAEVVQLLEVDAPIPGKHKGDGLFCASWSYGLLPDFDPVIHNCHPLKEPVDGVRFRPPWP
jgi:hypothetical protein